MELEDTPLPYTYSANPLIFAKITRFFKRKKPPYCRSSCNSDIFSLISRKCKRLLGVRRVEFAIGSEINESVEAKDELNHSGESIVSGGAASRVADDSFWWDGSDLTERMDTFDNIAVEKVKLVELHEAELNNKPQGIVNLKSSLIQSCCTRVNDFWNKIKNLKSNLDDCDAKITNLTSEVNHFHQTNLTNATKIQNEISKLTNEPIGVKNCKTISTEGEILPREKSHSQVYSSAEQLAWFRTDLAYRMCLSGITLPILRKHNFNTNTSIKGFGEAVFNSASPEPIAIRGNIFKNVIQDDLNSDIRECYWNRVKNADISVTILTNDKFKNSRHSNSGRLYARDRRRTNNPYMYTQSKAPPNVRVSWMNSNREMARYWGGSLFAASCRRNRNNDRKTLSGEPLSCYNYGKEDYYVPGSYFPLLRHGRAHGRLREE